MFAELRLRVLQIFNPQISEAKVSPTWPRHCAAIKWTLRLNVEIRSANLQIV